MMNMRKRNLQKNMEKFPMKFVGAFLKKRDFFSEFVEKSLNL